MSFGAEAAQLFCGGVSKLRYNSGGVCGQKAWRGNAYSVEYGIARLVPIHLAGELYSKHVRTGTLSRWCCGGKFLFLFYSILRFTGFCVQ
ncbi:unnamed protein product [Prunus armeniaca]|uniref:Uncharacterized protein n=1 Tax=Prunus armeniaca TaxID=36596 RepID=A0A6J5UA67_PRUAR|nr:unnamed protein product [Prunus armeniaca]CAB4303697.1 unnamed protein product [Prunus armeniaca]